jgi:hypothetical protein
VTSRRSGFAIAAGILLVLTATASAQEFQESQESPADPTSEARELFDEGVARMDQEQWGEAAGLFQRALALRSSAQITYNLALAFANEGRIIRAASLMRQVVGDPAADAEARDRAQTMLDEMSPRLALLDATARPARSAQPAQPAQPVRSARSDRRTALPAAAAEERGASAIDLRVSAADEGSDNLVTKWWLWAGVAAVVGTVSLILALTLGGGSSDPIAGNGDMPVIHIGGRP